MRINAVYFSREALASFRKNWVQSAAAVTTVALCLVVVGIIVITLYIGGQLINKVESQVEIEVFLKDTAPYNEVQAFQDKVMSWSEMRKVEYVSKQDALKKFRKDFKDKPIVLANLQGNPLPASFRIWLKNPREVEKIAARIKKISNIDQLVADKEDDISYGSEYVGRLFAFTRRLSLAAIAFAVLLAFVSLVLITNTIRLAIFARRKEIGIMKLVGASSWFIRIPFVLEGMIEGALGAGIAILVLSFVYRTFFINLATGRWLAFMSIPLDQGAFLRVLLLLASSGIIIGALGSALALRRFLRV